MHTFAHFGGGIVAMIVGNTAFYIQHMTSILILILNTDILILTKGTGPNVNNSACSCDNVKKQNRGSETFPHQKEMQGGRR